MKKDFHLGLERLDQKVLLSSNPWYIDAIKADQLWNISSVVGSKPIVAIVDSGIDLNHSSLKQDIWVNPGEKLDGIDNDGNGYVDDINGWNFSNNTNNVQDGYYHGTHVAGIIDVVSNNKVSIMPIKFMDNSGVGYTGAAAAAINYATLMKSKGINIVAINCSFGGLSSYSSSLANSIKNASDNGIAVIIAAGNNGTNLDVTPLYPGSFSYANSITVGAISSDNSLLNYSNYGVKSVPIAAPGSDIYSTLPNNSYGYVSGTSMAAPMVSGGIGLLWSLGGYSSSIILDGLKRGASFIKNLENKVTYGLLDLSSSFNILKTQITKLPQPVVAPISSTPVVIPAKLVYSLDKINNRIISGWTNVDTKTTKPIVQIYVNTVLRYSVPANLYRIDTRKNNGFYVNIDRKFLSFKLNQVIVKIVDSSSKLSEVIYKGYMKR